eukprot:NODE_645_length_1884_cov_6.764578_g517_i0.p4 GENE.NODE_645_length_1884_cov_6.764578_g517_i0~~NODE_645_length_1884_cov_6.764578_g517_i0.p4  ORF type:complete len:61 (+),score=11.61 NODE_645_length_1884_cov_6.764578_g517_i0:301-483(+)
MTETCTFSALASARAVRRTSRQGARSGSRSWVSTAKQFFFFFFARTCGPVRCPFSGLQGR